MQVNFLEIAIRFLVGGTVIVAVWILSQLVSPKVAGVIAVIPSTFAIAYIFSVSSSSPEVMNKFVVGSVYGIIAWLVFLPALYFLNIRFSFWIALMLAFGVWIIAAFTLNYLRINS